MQSRGAQAKPGEVGEVGEKCCGEKSGLALGLAQ